MVRLLTLSVCALLCLVAAPHAGEAATDGDHDRRADWRLSLGVVAGVHALDADLADYRWDVSPGLRTGFQATVYRGRFAAGVRYSRSQTTQSSGIPGETLVPRVNMTGIDFLGQVRAVGYRRVELWGLAHAGTLHLGYTPDHLTFDVGGFTTPVRVEYDPITEWDYGLGLELRGELTEHMALAVQAEGSTFALDTAHRRGDEIVESRERFYSWSLLLHVSWLLNLR